MVSSGDPLIGLTLGNFRITHVLGQGAMGAVYAAQHVSLPSRAAVKVLLSEFARDQAAVDRFLREAHTASSINDPHVVRIFDAGRLPDGRPYLLMDLLEGHTLDEALAQGPLDLRRGVEIIRQIASAVAVVHEHGILHRDLKPSNVHLGQSRGVEVAKVLDFGLARSHGLGHGVTSAGTVLGTPLYMSPEQAGAQDVGPESDVYSLGCVAHEVLSGQPPFLGDSAVTVMHKHLTEAPQDVRSLRHGLPFSLAQLITRCLSKSPADRPVAKAVAATLDAIAKELDHAATDATFVGGPPPKSPLAVSHVAPSQLPTVRDVGPGVLSTQAPPTVRDSSGMASQAAVAGTLQSVALPPRRVAPVAAVVGVLVLVLAAAGVAYFRPHESRPTPVAAASAQAVISDEKNPFSVTDSAAVEAGRAVWVAKCAQCHGVHGDGAGSDIPSGVRPKSFCDVVLPPGTLDVYYFGIIRHGVERGDRVAMPAFDEKLAQKESQKLDLKATWQVVTYINTLRPKVHKVDVDQEIAAGPQPDTAETRDRGSNLFYTRCSTCHGEDGKGDGAAASLFASPPPDLKDDAWNERTLKPGDDDLKHVFRIMTTGSGENMGSFSSVTTKDRWALARYVVALRPPSAPAPSASVPAAKPPGRRTR
jgi:serine/threonine protein kinase/mono/diheme cytochrome c family protein